MTTRLPLGFSDNTLRRFIRALQRWEKLGTRKLVERVVGGTTRTVIRRSIPILAAGDPTVSRLLIGWAADSGKREAKRRKERGPTGMGQVAKVVEDVALHFNEGIFTLLGAGVQMVDAMTDAILPDGLFEDIVDVPEEAIRDAAFTLAKVARALRTGER